MNYRKVKHETILSMIKKQPAPFQPLQTTGTPPLKIPNKVKPIKRTRRKKRGPSASWEISALIKQAWFLSPSVGIMGLAHYSPDYCFTPAITEKSQ